MELGAEPGCLTIDPFQLQRPATRDFAAIQSPMNADD